MFFISVTFGMGFQSGTEYDGLIGTDLQTPMLGINDELRFKAIKPSTTIALSEPDFRRALFNSPDLALGIVRTLAMALHRAVLRIEA